MEIGCWLRENLRKMRCFLGGAIGLLGRYIVEEGRRERAGGGGEKRKVKGTLVSLFILLCVCFGL